VIVLGQICGKIVVKSEVGIRVSKGREGREERLH
jgi:hypothetical protein